MQLHHECLEWRWKHGSMEGFAYTQKLIEGLRNLYQVSNVEQKENTFEDFLLFIHQSILVIGDGKYSMIGSVAWFIMRVLEVGFDNARAQLSEENQDFIKTNLLKIELI